MVSVYGSEGRGVLFGCCVASIWVYTYIVCDVRECGYLLVLFVWLYGIIRLLYRTLILKNLMTIQQDVRVAYT